ncbi:hypothetical protein GCM10020295_45970 [Streptomyces cinereospinus]
MIPDRHTATDLVSRYGKEARRLQVDLRHERESRIMRLRHQLETDFLELSHTGQLPWGEVEGLIQSLIPSASSALQIVSNSPVLTGGTPVSVHINQQIVHAVESTVVQSVQGTMNYSPEAKELLRMIQQVGGNDASALEVAVHEVEDEEARPEERLSAKQKLRAFLARNREAAEGFAVGALFKYLESKLGI